MQMKSIIAIALLAVSVNATAWQPSNRSSQQVTITGSNFRPVVSPAPTPTIIPGLSNAAVHALIISPRTCVKKFGPYCDARTLKTK
jgi:hypothetical protein